jgi:hypothetical protein
VKPLLMAAALGALGLAVSGGATLLGDRTTFVSPPDARAEAFLRQLMSGRAELARKFVSRDVRTEVSPPALQLGFEALEAQLGDVEDVTTRTLFLDRQSAVARAELVARGGGRMTLEFGFKWELNGWAIRELPCALRPAAVADACR